MWTGQPCSFIDGRCELRPIKIKRESYINKKLLKHTLSYNFKPFENLRQTFVLEKLSHRLVHLQFKSRP